MTEMKIKKLLPVDAESRRLIDWMEKGMFKLLSDWLFEGCSGCFNLLYCIYFPGVYDALQKKYLKTLLFCVCEAVDGPMIEEYACKVLTNLIFILGLLLYMLVIKFRFQFNLIWETYGRFINITSFLLQFPLAIRILTSRRFPWISTALEARSRGEPSSVTRLQTLLPSRWGLLSQ